jgi:hypothetical protein
LSCRFLLALAFVTTTVRESFYFPPFFFECHFLASHCSPSGVGAIKFDQAIYPELRF